MMKNYSAFNRRMLLVFSALPAIVASFALEAEPRPPSCLSADGTPPAPGATCCDSTPTAYADENGQPGNGTVINNLLTRSDTFHSIGFVWDVDGDTDHDGLVSVRYRKAGACTFAPAMPLMRNDYAWFWHDEGAAEPANNFAGSLMFLTPGTTYEVVLELSDPDGGRAIRVRDLTTRAIPRKPTAGRTLYVVPGSGGGDGSDGNPFRGINAANAAALPGDRMLLRNGTYTGRAPLSTSGAADNYIVWEPDTGHSPVVAALEINGDHIWIDQISFAWDGNGSSWHDKSAIFTPPPGGAPDDIVITNNDFTGYTNSIFDLYSGTNWTVMDNTIVGNKAVGVGSGETGDFDGLGVSLSHRGGHVVAYNSVTRVADGIDATEDSDVYGNQVWDLSDDGIEPDHSYANVRVWGNRVHEVAGSSLSFQPQKAGPWYFLYNQIGQAGNGIFKWRVQDRLVFINNTFLQGTNQAQFFMKTVTRNNLFIGGGPIWSGRDVSTDPGQEDIQSPAQWMPSWNTDVDYDGSDWGGGNTAFSWFDGTESYTDIASFGAAVGVEQNGIRVDRNVVFEDYVVSRDHALTLNPSGNAVDAGAFLPNLADFFKGAAPDLGAHETGAAPLHYGPRNGTVLHEHVLRWAKH